MSCHWFVKRSSSCICFQEAPRLSKMAIVVVAILLLCINEDTSGASAELDTGVTFVEDSDSDLGVRWVRNRGSGSLDEG